MPNNIKTLVKFNCKKGSFCNLGTDGLQSSITVDMTPAAIKSLGKTKDQVKRKLFTDSKSCSIDDDSHCEGNEKYALFTACSTIDYYIIITIFNFAENLKWDLRFHGDLLIIF